MRLRTQWAGRMGVAVCTLALLGVATAWAEPVTIYSTGVDDLGVPLPEDSIDPHWIMSGTDPEGQAVGPDAFVTTSVGGFPVPPWAGDNAQSTWITPAADTNAPGGVSYQFSTTFTTPGDGLLLIEGQQSADNTLEWVTVDGMPGTITPGGFTGLSPFAVLVRVTGTEHTLVFSVNNAGDVLNPMGFRAQIDRAEWSPGAITNELGLFNTGVDGAGVVLADDAVDPHWTVSGTGAGAGVGPSAFAATSAGGGPIPPWVGDNPSSAWISPSTDTVAPGAPDNSTVYTYTTSFTTSGRGRIRIAGIYSSDDIVTDVKVDGVSGAFLPGGFGGYSPFLVTANVVGTDHTLSFSVINGSAEPNPNGLRVEIAISEFVPVLNELDLFNTGVDANNVVLPDNAVDPHWTLSGVGAASGVGPDAIVATSAGAFPIGPWLGDNNTSAWVTPSPDTNGPGAPDNTAIYTYTTTFKTPGLANGQVVIEGLQATDDVLAGVAVDGIPGTFTPGGFGGFSPFAVTVDVTGTDHVLTLSVINGGAGPNPQGLRVEITKAEFTPKVNVLNLFNTGVDDNAVPLADNAVDPHWIVTPPEGVTDIGPDALAATGAAGFPIPPWTGDNLASAWIVPTPDTNAPGGFYTYETTFTTPGDGLVLIDARQSTDDLLAAVQVDGVPGTFTSVGFGGFGPLQVLTRVTGTQHTLKITVENGGPNLNPTGLRVEFDRVLFIPPSGPGQFKIYNTGVDDNEVVLPEDATDPHYTLRGSGPAEGVGPAAAVTTSAGGFPIPPWVGDLPTSAWLTPSITSSGVGATDGSAVYYYETTFKLPAARAQITIEGLYAADNGLVDVQVNGVSGTFTPGGFGALVPFAFSGEVVGSTHTLSFLVQNGAGEATPDGPTGIRVEIIRTSFVPIGTPIKLYNTGVDNAGVALGDNAVDPHYTLSGSGAAAGQGPAAIVATSAGGFPIGPWLGDNATSAWVTPSESTAGPGATDGTALYTFTTHFTTPGAGIVRIEGIHVTDNALVDVKVDGVSGTFTPTGFNVPAPFLIETPVVGSQHTLTFVVQNGANEANPDGPLGLRVQIDKAMFFATGDCPDPFADADSDGDVDQEDFGFFQACYTGEVIGVSDACRCFDRDGGEGDGDIDSVDLAAFENCATGPAMTASTACDD